MRRPVVVFLVIVAAGVAALVVVAASEQRTLAFTLGVPSFGAVAELRPGQQACQLPVPVGAAFDAVELHLGTYERAGSPLTVTVAEEPGGTLLGSGQLAAGYADNARVAVPVGDVDDDQDVKVCIRNDGRRRVALYGGPDVTARTSSATVNGRANGSDLDLVFRAESRSTLSLVPDMLARAALFRGGWIGTWLLWLLFAGVLIAVPALLARALRGVGDERDG